MGCVLSSDFCRALDGKIAWTEVGEVCGKCAVIAGELANVGKPLSECTLYE